MALGPEHAEIAEKKRVEEQRKEVKKALCYLQEVAQAAEIAIDKCIQSG